MQQRRSQRREPWRLVLWSGFFALWHDQTRRGALPLLLATLLLLLPPLPARSDCCCEEEASHHEMTLHHQDHDSESDGGAQHHLNAKPSDSHLNTAAARAAHAQFAGASPSAVSRAMPECCSGSRLPLNASVVAVPAPSNSQADSLAFDIPFARAASAYRFDALTGLFGRAGPAPDGKPQILVLASLAGRAPPLSI